MDPRTEAELQVQLTDGGGADSLRVSTLNVGTGGVYVRIPRFIEPLTKLMLEMDIPGPTPDEEAARIRAEAIVVRTVPEKPQADTATYEIACAFLDLPDQARDIINRYVLTHRTSAPA